MILSKELSEMFSSGEGPSKEAPAEDTGNFSSLLSDDMKVFLGVKEEGEPLTQLAANESFQFRRSVMEVYKDTGEWYGDEKFNPNNKSKGKPPAEPESKKVVDKEEERRYLENRRKGDRPVRAEPPPTSNVIVEQPDEEFKGGFAR